MNDVQYTHLNAYVREIADLLRLRDLSVTLDHNPPGSDCRGMSQGIYGQPELRVWLDLALLLEPDQLRETVVHELLHAHFNPMRDLFLHVYDGEPSEDVPGVFYRAFKERWEFCLETMARIIAPSLPLIAPLPEDK